MKKKEKELMVKLVTHVLMGDNKISLLRKIFSGYRTENGQKVTKEYFNKILRELFKRKLLIRRKDSLFVVLSQETLESSGDILAEALKGLGVLIVPKTTLLYFSRAIVDIQNIIEDIFKEAKEKNIDMEDDDHAFIFSGLIMIDGILTRGKDILRSLLGDLNEKYDKKGNRKK